MAYIQEKIKGKKIVSFKFKTCLGRDANGKQIFKCWTWHPPVDLTPAKARKEADRVADRWEAEQRLAFSQQKAEEPSAPPAPVYTFDTFVNEVWIPLCVRDGSHRPATVAMYTNILKVILPQFQGVPLVEITGVRISQYLRWLRNDYRKPDGKPLAEKSIKHHYNVLDLIFGFAERQDIIQKNLMKKVDTPKVVLKVFDDLLDFLGVGFVCFLQQVVQQIEQFQPLILRSALALFAIRHSYPSRIGIFLLLYHRNGKSTPYLENVK